MIELNVSSKVAENESGLFLKKYNVRFGKFNLLSLITYNEILVYNFSKFCSDRGYMEKWIFNKKHEYFELVKCPMALLAEILFCQTDVNILKEMYGAWSIGLSKYSSSLNVIVCCKDKKIEKFSLYYPFGVHINRKYELLIENGISFRTGIFNSRNINKCREIMYSLEDMDGIIANFGADAIYIDPNKESINRINVLEKFVNNLVKNERHKLCDSYMKTGFSALEDEWHTVKKILN